MVSVWNIASAMLRLMPVGIWSFTNIRAAVIRIANFLQSDELKPYVQYFCDDDKNAIEIDSANFRWSDEVCLKNINLVVPKGRTVVITGSVGQSLKYTAETSSGKWHFLEFLPEI